MRPAHALSLGVAVLALALSGCGGGKGGATEQAATATSTLPDSATAVCEKTVAHQHEDGGYPNKNLKLDPNKTYRLVFETNCGNFTITLDPKTAPNATGSLVSLAQRGFFKDTFFHRIVPQFVIQGGDPTGTGLGGPGYKTHDKVPATAAYTHGVVAMAKSQRDPAGTAGSQFFVVTGQDVGLPPDYAVVGKVTSGLDVVDKIGELGDPNQQPTENVVIKNVRVVSS
jgi:cyclophilin family peptidyl-prolyl cis-trans isomerase